MKNLLITLKSKIPTAFKKEVGATMVEYAIMLALIAVVSIVIVKALGTSVSSVFDTVNTSLQTTG